MADLERTAEQLGLLALAKNQTVRPQVISTYAKMLVPYPQEAVDAAILALCTDPGEFFPPVGKIIAGIARWLQGDPEQNPEGAPQAPMLAPDAAWLLARRTVAAYQPETRPFPRSGNPAIDATIRALGGAVACQWTDAIGEGIVRRAFLDEYARQAATPAHIAWALQGGATLPRVVPGLELPDHEQERLKTEANRLGRPLPEPVRQVLTGTPERAVVLSTAPEPLPAALPPPEPAPMPDEQRQAMREEIKAGIARMVARMRLPK